MADRTPDAVRAPLGFAGPGDALSRLTKLQTEFAPVLGVPRVFVRHQGVEHFLSGDSGDTLYHVSQGPRAGEPRYEWQDRGDGVQYGYLRRDD
jgi:hypothetical protein